MGKKEQQKKPKYTSKGQRRSVANGLKTKYDRDAYEVWAAKRKAWAKGMNVLLDASHVGGPVALDNKRAKLGTKKAKHGWGDPRDNKFKMPESRG